MEEKNEYLPPELSIVAFSARDVIATSGEGGFDGEVDEEW